MMSNISVGVTQIVNVIILNIFHIYMNNTHILRVFYIYLTMHIYCVYLNIPNINMTKMCSNINSWAAL